MRRRISRFMLSYCCCCGLLVVPTCFGWVAFAPGSAVPPTRGRLLLPAILLPFTALTGREGVTIASRCPVPVSFLFVSPLGPCLFIFAMIVLSSQLKPLDRKSTRL